LLTFRKKNTRCDESPQNGDRQRLRAERSRIIVAIPRNRPTISTDPACPDAEAFDRLAYPLNMRSRVWRYAFT
jgi:hypothetical protein